MFESKIIAFKYMEHFEEYIIYHMEVNDTLKDKRVNALKTLSALINRSIDKKKEEIDKKKEEIRIIDIELENLNQAQNEGNSLKKMNSYVKKMLMMVVIITVVYARMNIFSWLPIHLSLC
jgi:cell shape-determining protein MreC